MSDFESADFEANDFEVESQSSPSESYGGTPAPPPHIVLANQKFFVRNVRQRPRMTINK